MTISPRVKSALQHAFALSRELGHSYVGPEHLLLGLAAVPDGFAGTLLKKYGLTEQALRRKRSRWSARAPRTAAWTARATLRNWTSSAAT